MKPTSRPRVVFSIGDVNGIGPEILARALARPEIPGLCVPVIAGNRRLVEEHCARVPGLHASALLAAEWIDLDSDATLNLGSVDGAAGRLAGVAIETAARAVLRGEADAMVTMPINKAGLHAGGFDFPGHTEMIASICGGTPLMILMTEGLRVALATIHEPIALVPSLLSRELLSVRLQQFHDTIHRDFGVARPVIAVLGLNPHAGENGHIGTEELETLGPALDAARERGMDVRGPLPADGYFARYTPHSVDGVLAMYHDQGLIPLKMFARGGGVNFTAALPVVRTSPDHGTAYEIAGRGVADDRSVVEAVRVAVEVAGNRRRWTAERQ